MTISESVTPEDLEQNLADVNHPEIPMGMPRTEDAYMEDGRMAATRRSAGIDMGKAVIMDREVFDAETIVRVKLDDREKNPYGQERHIIPKLQLDSTLNNKDRRLSSLHGVVDNSRSSFRSKERRNSHPLRIGPMRPSYVSTDASRLDSSRRTFIHLDSLRPDASRTTDIPVQPSTRVSHDSTRTSFAKVDLQRPASNRTIPVDAAPAPQPADPIKPCYSSSRPSMVTYPESGYSPAYRRGDGLLISDDARQPSTNLFRTSSPGVDSARPSLSVFRFKQTPANGGNLTPSLPPRSPSPGRRNSATDASSVMKPTFSSARRSTYHANVGSEKRLSRSPARAQFLDRRISTGDVATSVMPPPTYTARRRTTTGDINSSKEPASPGAGKRYSRMPLQGPFGAVVLSWTNLTVRSRHGKILLDNLSGQVHTGFTAIMGPSGSGKSTLLNTIGCRLDKSTTVSGQIRLNGLEYTNTDLKQISGYVMQDDLLNPHLTVDETLWYTVKLKLEPTFTEAELGEKVDAVVKQMGLDHCRGTVIGSPLRKGISGGERKRVAVGMELLTSPQLLLLDEPTSGLDSGTALSICTLLTEIAVERFCTVVCTIHQPQSRIFNLFQFLIILKSGKLIYQGSGPGVLKFFEDSGFPCPELTNPADHLLDVLSHTDKYFLQSNEEKLRSNLIANPVNLEEGADRPLYLNRERMPWHRQFLVLLNRGYKEQYRKRNVVLTQMIQNVVTALLIGGVFFHIGHFQKSTTRRQPVLFFCVINQGVFGALTVINSFPSERVLILRERAAGMYYCSAYYMAKAKSPCVLGTVIIVHTILIQVAFVIQIFGQITAETTFQLISPIIFSLVVYWMVGFQLLARKFFLFTFFMILCQLSATSLALMTSALCRTTDLSVTVLPMLLEVNRLFGGFFLAPVNLPKYFSWLDALSYVKYCYVAISQSELDGLELSCLPNELKGGICPITSGMQTIKALGLDYITIADCAGILIVYIIVTRFVAYLGIRYIKH